MTALLYLAFFLSTAVALIFQTFFFPIAGLTFGSSFWASSPALSSFIGGTGTRQLALHAFRKSHSTLCYFLPLRFELE